MNLTFLKMSTKWAHVHVRRKELLDVLKKFDADIAVALSTDAHVRRLNRDFRGMDKPTNVLSFPNGIDGGDVILAYETLAREARIQDKPFRDHFEHLIIHGCLHIVGYDHENDAQAKAMETLETRLCKKLGFVPYEGEDNLV